jgi:hypothetical protein
MSLERRFAFALAAALVGAAVGQTAELPAQNAPENAPNKKPNQAEPTKLCNIAGAPGIQAANGVCVRFTGYLSTGVSAGQIK